jgi:hypothetical protein
MKFSKLGEAGDMMNFEKFHFDRTTGFGFTVYGLFDRKAKSLVYNTALHCCACGDNIPVFSRTYGPNDKLKTANIIAFYNPTSVYFAV